MNATEMKLTATRPPAETERSAFVEAYGRAVLGWCRQFRLPEFDADSLAHDLMGLLHREFIRADLGPNRKFRTWLRLVGRTAWGELTRWNTPSHQSEPSSPIAEVLLDEAALAGFLDLLDAECSHQRRRELLPRVQSVADPTDWDIFYRVVLEGAAEVDLAAQANATRYSIRAAVFRVYRLLQEELKRVEELF